MHNNIFDNSKAKRELGFIYTVPFEQGVKRCFEYLSRHNLIEACENFPFYDELVVKWKTFEQELLKNK
jgi:hypothetical protein